MSLEFLLEAVDGGNPLAFLSALGALRLSQLRWPATEVRLAWERSARWTPRLSGLPIADQQELCAELLRSPGVPVETFGRISKTLPLRRMYSENSRERPAKRQLVRIVEWRISRLPLAARRVATIERRIECTALCFITGSGHQDFLGTMAGLTEVVEADHLQEALFGGWQTRDKGLAFRWDPGDAREYALRWNDPGPEGARTTWGANRLAVEAMPFFPVHPNGGRLLTTGFRRGRKTHEFTWPVWTDTLSCDEVRSLLSWKELQEEAPQRLMLKAVGVQEVFRPQRVRIGTGANFKVSFRPARAI